MSNLFFCDKKILLSFACDCAERSVKKTCTPEMEKILLTLREFRITGDGKSAEEILYPIYLKRDRRKQYASCLAAVRNTSPQQAAKDAALYSMEGIANDVVRYMSARDLSISERYQSIIGEEVEWQKSRLHELFLNNI